jgi:hypothetical protein
VPDSSQTQPAAFNCEGGLVLNRSSFLMQPGEALVLENFEPDVEGGYRRMNGFRRYVNHIVPHTASINEKVIGVAKFGNKVIACRGEKIFSAASTELSFAITAAATMSGSGTIIVDSVAGFATSGTLQIDSELFTYTGVDSASKPNEFTGVTRSSASTTATAHVTKITVSST